MKNPFLFALVFILLISLSACGSSQIKTNPAAVIEAIDVAWNAQDVDALLSLYADDAIDMNGRGSFYGEGELRSLFEGMIGEFTVDCGNYFVAGREVSYDCLYVVTNTGSLAGERYTAVVVDGKIKAPRCAKPRAAPELMQIPISRPVIHRAIQSRFGARVRSHRWEESR